MNFLILYTKNDATYINIDLIDTFVVCNKKINWINYKDGVNANDFADVVKWELI